MQRTSTTTRHRAPADPWEVVRAISAIERCYARQVAVRDLLLGGWPEGHGIGSSDVSGRLVTMVERGDLEVIAGHALFHENCEAARFFAPPRRQTVDTQALTIEEAVRNGSRFDFKFTGSREDLHQATVRVQRHMMCYLPDGVENYLSYNQITAVIAHGAAFPSAPPAAIDVAIAAFASVVPSSIPSSSSEAKP